MKIEIAAQIAGTADYRDVGQADHPITSEERQLAVDVSYELAAHYGIDLDGHVTAHRAMLARLDALA